MTLDELALALSEESFSEALLPDSEGRYAFSCDDIELVLAPGTSGSTALIAATLADIEEAWKPGIAQVLLEMNYLFKGGNGAVFSVNPETKAFTLQKTLLLENSREALLDVIARFLMQVERWEAFLRYPQEEAVDPKAIPAEAAETHAEAINTNWISV